MWPVGWMVEGDSRLDVGRMMIPEREESGPLGEIRNEWIIEKFRQ